MRLDDPIQEVPVVRHDHQGAAESAEPFLQPGQAVQVQVVGRLVHQQDVRLLQQDLGQRRAVAPPAGQLVDRARTMRLVEAQLGQHCVDLVLVVPAAAAVHLLQKVGLLVQQAHERFAGRLLFQQDLHLQQRLLQRVEIGEDLIEHLLDGLFAVQLGELGEVADPDPLVDFHRTFIRLFLVQDEFEEGGLARAVPANQADAVAGAQAEEDVAQHWAVAVRFGNIVDADQTHVTDALPCRL